MKYPKFSEWLDKNKSGMLRDITGDFINITEFSEFAWKARQYWENEITPNKANLTAGRFLTWNEIACALLGTKEVKKRLKEAKK